ncbi:hypothetical protein [Enterococcus sp. AZ109]|uniref:hypothetical protein n=1 Tax=Enterococcus sp. AZ109 TaxID=2774634 RepID=UPI003F24092D
MKNMFSKLDSKKFKQWMTSKKGKCIFVGTFLIIGCLLFFRPQWVLKVNGQAITTEEYTFFQEMYPLLSEEELQARIVEDKVQLQEAKKLKLEVVDNHKTLMKELETINKENKEKIKNQEVVYGLREYDPETFYAYSLSNTINKVKETMRKEITNKSVKNYYEENEEQFKSVDSKEIYQIQAPKETLETLMQSELNLEQLDSIEGVAYKAMPINESTMRDWIKYRNEELGSVMDLSAKSWSTIFSSETKDWVYYCTETKEGELQPLTDVEESIRIQLEKDYYQAQLTKWVQGAKIERKE